MTARVFDIVATVVRVVASTVAAIIVVHAAFVLFEANSHNALVEFTASIRDTFGSFTKDLFTKPNPKMAQVINDVLAALVWIIAGTVISKLIVRFAPATKAKAKAS